MLSSYRVQAALGVALAAAVFVASCSSDTSARRTGTGPSASVTSSTTHSVPKYHSARIARPSPTSRVAVGAHDRMIYTFGDAAFQGSALQLSLVAPTVALAPAAGSSGYWLVARDGGVFSFGVPFLGAVTQRAKDIEAVGIAATPSGRGYWVASRDARVFAFGDALNLHPHGTPPRPGQIIAIAAMPSGGGYWLLAANGRVFAFGRATLYGSVAGKRLNAPVVGIAATPSGRGYWLVAADGGVFTFGDAHFAGSLAGRPHDRVSGIASGMTAHGYWVVARDCGVFSFGDAPFLGSAVGLLPTSSRVVAISAVLPALGYRLLAVNPPPPVRSPIAPAFPRSNAPAHPRPPAPLPPPAAPSPPAAVTGGVTAIGDSVMIDAAPALYALIPGIRVDASVSRQAADGVGLLSSLAASGQLRAAVVWHLGTNGTLTAGQIDQVLQIAAGRRVVMVTDHCPYCSWTASNNATIYATCSATRNCLIADWNALANANPAWFGEDGVHMAIGGTGAQAYARLVASRL